MHATPFAAQDMVKNVTFPSNTRASFTKIVSGIAKNLTTYSVGAQLMKIATATGSNGGGATMIASCQVSTLRNFASGPMFLLVTILTRLNCGSVLIHKKQTSSENHIWPLLVTSGHVWFHLVPIGKMTNWCHVFLLPQTDYHKTP